jgi:hypothetical protein
MWSVEEMLGLGRFGLDRDGVQDFLGRAIAKSLERLYPGLEHGRGHLGESRLRVWWERLNESVVRAYRLNKAARPCVRRHHRRHMSQSTSELFAVAGKSHSPEGGHLLTSIPLRLLSHPNGHRP